MRQLLRLLAAAVAALFAPSAQAAPRGSDAQLWTEVDLDAPLGPRLALSALAVARGGEGLPAPTVMALGGALAFAPSTHWTIGAGDYWVRVRSAATGATTDLQLPLAAITYQTRLGGFALSDRNRVERVTGLPGEDNWRYRNRLAVSHPVALGPIRSVFVADEVFHDGSRDSWSRNRAQAGIGLRSIGPAALQLYYLRQDDRFARPGALNVLGIALELSLGGQRA